MNQINLNAPHHSGITHLICIFGYRPRYTYLVIIHGLRAPLPLDARWHLFSILLVFQFLVLRPCLCVALPRAPFASMPTILMPSSHICHHRAFENLASCFPCKLTIDIVA